MTGEVLGGAGLICLGAFTIYSARTDRARVWARVWFLRLVEVPEWYERALLVVLGAAFVAAGLAALYAGLAPR
jgi:uncharacterized membrane protein HdeD (DUF308 family)